MENKGFVQELKDELKGDLINFINLFKSSKKRIDINYNCDETKEYIQNQYDRIDRMFPAVANNENLSKIVHGLVCKITKLNIATDEYADKALAAGFGGGLSMLLGGAVSYAGCRIIGSDELVMGLEAGLFGVGVLALGKAALDCARAITFASDSKKAKNKLIDILEENAPEDTCGNIVNINAKKKGGVLRRLFENMISSEPVSEENEADLEAEECDENDYSAETEGNESNIIKFNPNSDGKDFE